MDAGCRIEMLGWLRAEQAGRVITRFRTYKTGALLAFLAYYPHPHPREQLIEMLWPECDPDAGRNSLSKALSSLRNQLEPPGVPSGTILVADRASVQLNPATCTTDVAAFEAALQAAARAERAGASPVPTLLSDAVELYRGELLPGYYEDWNLRERQRLNDAYLQALDQLIGYREQAGDLRRAIDYAHRAVQADPLREECHAALIRLYIASGEPGAALRQYQELERILDKDVGSEPSPETQSLLRALPPRTPRPKSAPAPPAREPAVDTPPADEPQTGLPAPAGTVTVLWMEAEADRPLPARVQDICRRHGGQEARETGNALAFTFGRATDAVASAVAAQRALTGDDPQATMALHTGETPEERGPSSEKAARLSEPVLDYARRVLLAAHRGQILCSEATAVLLRRDAEPGLKIVDLGVYRLRGLEHAERLFDVEFLGRREAAFPPPHAEPGINSTLPLSFTRFFGREEEMARLTTLIQNPGSSRLITLTGPGGTGKTRLSLETARQLLGPLRGAVWFVPLADLFDGRLVAEAIADSLALPRSPAAPPLRQVVEALSRQRSLLVLDNFEQLLREDDPNVEYGLRTVRTLLEQVPSLVILTSSRQRLGLTGEREFPVTPLPTPTASRATSPVGTGASAPEALVRFESVQLFADRAQAVQPDFQVTPGNAAAVAALCERLEGIPLAIELAAARAQVLTPAQMLGQLENRLDFLVSRQRDTVLRHRTIREAIDWSYRLLSPDLQRFFGRLSVFRGGWSREAAETVCEEPLALDALSQLAECSLIIAETAGETGEIRFRMLETLREYAEGILTPDDQAALRERHARYFLQLAETAEAALTGPEQRAWLGRLEQEHDNLRAVLEWSKTADQGHGIGLRVAGALWRFWWIRGHQSEGRERLAELLALPETSGANADAHDAAGEEAAWAKAYVAAGSLARTQGDYDAARALLQEGLARQRRLGDKQGIATSLNFLGLVSFEQSDHATARARFEESLLLFREVGDRPGIAYALNTLGFLHSVQGDYDAARPLLEESLALRRELDDKQAIASSLNNLGNVPLLLGDFAQARPLFEESLALRRELGDKQGIPVSLNSLGYMALLQGNPEAARPLFEESLALLRETGDKHGIATTLNNLGDVAVLQNDFGQARAVFDEGLAIVVETGDAEGIAYALEGYARLAAAQNRFDRATILWAATEKLRETIGIPLPPADRAYYERAVAMVRAQMEAEPFAAAWTKGRALTQQQAVALALDDPSRN